MDEHTCISFLHTESGGLAINFGNCAENINIPSRILKGLY